jgi:hypothetical protein
MVEITSGTHQFGDFIGGQTMSLLEELARRLATEDARMGCGHA